MNKAPNPKPEDSAKTCFVVAPIGSVGSEIRRRSDCLLEYIVKPAFLSLGYDVPERIDEVDEAGQITLGIIRRIYEAKWVVADLSGLNANVFYEIGIRHAVQKPIIHLSNDLQSIPFDNANQNTIGYVHDDPSSHKTAIERIKKQVMLFDERNEAPSTPVSLSLGQLKLEKSGDSESSILASVLERLEVMEMRQKREIGKMPSDRETSDESVYSLIGRRVSELMSSDPSLSVRSAIRAAGGDISIRHSTRSDEERAAADIINERAFHSAISTRKIK